MPNMENPLPSRDELIRLKEIRDNLERVGTRSLEPVIFAPTQLEFTRALNRSLGYISARQGGYQGKLEKVSGLKVVHKGIVLGEPGALTGHLGLPDIEIPPELQSIDRLASEIEGLSDEERQALQTRLSASTEAIR